VSPSGDNNVDSGVFENNMLRRTFEEREKQRNKEKD
jgi:hypothetical protein